MVRSGLPEVIDVAESALPEHGNVRDPDQVDAAALNPADVATPRCPLPGSPDGSHFWLGWDVAGTVDTVSPGAALELGTLVIAIVQGATGIVRRGRHCV